MNKDARTGNGLIAVALFLIAAALRVPFRSALAFNWDNAQFVLAMREYSIALSQPHAPGYFAYVGLANLVNWFVGDPQASLVWISVVAGAALCGVLFLLGAAMFGRRAGVVAGLLAATSPLLWLNSCVGLTYIVDAFLVVLTVWCCWRAIQHDGTWTDAVVIGALLAVVGGVRPQSVPALVPVVLLTFWKFAGRRVAKLMLATGVAFVLGLLWFVPMVATTGGLAEYLEIVRLYGKLNAQFTLLGSGWDAFVRNVTFVTVACGNGLMLGTVVLLGALLYRAMRMTTERRRVWDATHALGLQMLAAWLTPMLLLGTVVGFTVRAGHVLGYLPVFLLLAGAVVAASPRLWPWLTAILCAGNVFAFTAWPPAWDRVFAGIGGTAREIRMRNEDLTAVVHAARAQFNPATTAILHADEFVAVGIRQFQLYLPEFANYQLRPDSTMPGPAGRPYWRTRAGRLEFVPPLDWRGHKNILLVVPPGENIEIFRRYLPNFVAGDAEPVRGSNGILFVLSGQSLSLRARPFTQSVF